MNRLMYVDSPDKNMKDSMGYNNEFQAMLDGLDDEDSIEVIHCSGKKRRLSIDQVKALERIFEVDNKLDPERKIKLAQELGLQPRQVAIWFQNRRARWKTKQLERDYHLLKANYEALQLSYSKVEQEKEGLVAELMGLKEKLGEENAETKQCSPNLTASEGLMYENHHLHHHEIYRNSNFCSSGNNNIAGKTDCKEGFSDSDSSGGVLNEDGGCIGNNNMNLQLISYPMTFHNNNNNGGLDHHFVSGQPVYHPHLLESRDVMVKGYHHHQQCVKVDEQNQFTVDHHVDSSCNFLSVDQSPVFWYCNDPRNQ